MRGSKIFRTFVVIPFLLTLVGCASLEKEMDLSGLRDINKQLISDTETGTPEALAAYLKAADPFDVPMADQAQVHREPLHLWNLSEAAHPRLIEERLSFRSALGDDAVFYLYHAGPLEGKKAILWVPGYGVSDLALIFLKSFFRAELDQGYVILFYTLPYHLERTAKGKPAGEGLLSVDTIRNLKTFGAVISELRTGLNFLHAQGVASVSGWGGSVGASFLWTLSTRETIDQMTLMIPVVDWTTLIFHRELKPTLEKLKARGFTVPLLTQAYAPFSPWNTKSRTDPARIQILYAKLDQLTPESLTLDFAAAKGITHVHGYDESHGSILLNGKMYQDYREFLAGSL